MLLCFVHLLSGIALEILWYCLCNGPTNTREIRIIFSYGFKLGHSVADTARNIDTAFRVGLVPMNVPFVVGFVNFLPTVSALVTNRGVCTSDKHEERGFEGRNLYIYV